MTKTIWITIWSVSGWLVALTALTPGDLLAGRELAPVPAPTRPAPEPAPPEPQALRREKAALQLRVAELEGQITRLERTAAQQASEVERHRAGLEQAVAELNRVSRERDKAAAKPSRRGSRASRSPGKRTPARGGTLSDRPALQALGDRLLVHGEIANRRQDDLSGVLHLELLDGDRVIDTARLLLDVPARGEAAYSHEFAITGYATGTFSARAVFEY